jgi:hypothetical protein
MKPLLPFFLLMILSLTSLAQEKKLDKIIKRDYQIIECTISKMSDKTVEYSLPNETITISLDVSLIAKIDFGSGRTQTFETVPATNNTSPENSQSTNAVNQNATIQENTIAVLPVPYVNAESLSSSEEMAKFAQNDIYSKLIAKSSNISPLTVQDLRTTNSLLRKAGIDYKNIDEIPIDELQTTLGVDHIIAAKISYTEKENQSSQTYTAGEIKGQNNKVKDKSVSATNTQNNKYYYYHVYFDLYKNKTKIFTQSRKPILAVKDSWIDTMTYLLKKSPIYTK